MLKNFLINLYNKIYQNQDLGQDKEKKDYYRFHPRFTFVVSVTSRCNFNCPHCLRQFVDQKKTLIQDLSLSVFETVLKEGKKINFSNISFSGGEPILHPEFEKLVELVKKYDYTFNFASNGWFYKEYLPIINRYRENLELIFLSLDGPTAEIHDLVRNQPNSFKRVMKAIDFYKKNHFPLMITSCITKQNYHRVEEIADLCMKLGLKQIKYAAVIYPEIPNSFTLTDEEKFEVVKKLFHLRRKFKDSLNIYITSSFFGSSQFLTTYSKLKQNINYCYVLNQLQFHIDPEGGMLFCCDIFKECKNKPLIQKIGFENAFKITLEVINEIKKRRLYDLLNNPDKINSTCDYCNKYIDKYLDLIIQKYQVDK